MKTAALLAILPVLATAGECIGVNGSWIRAADLRGMVPELGSLPPETPLWRTPALGATRQVRKMDWDALGRQLSTALPPRDLCVVQSVRQVELSDWAVALAHSIVTINPAAKAEITGVSHAQLPEGRIEFPPLGLSRVRGNSYLWRGRLLQSGGHEVPLWIRFDCAVWRETLVAKRNLRTGEQIAGNDLVVEKRPGWLNQPTALALSSATGRTVRRPIGEGSEVLPSDLVNPSMVQAGQPARVTVLGNGTTLELPAVATQSGRLGDRILMENPVNRRRFAAVVTGPQAVSVFSGPKGDN